MKMITTDHPLIQLLVVIDRVWMERETVELKLGAPKSIMKRCCSRCMGFCRSVHLVASGQTPPVSAVLVTV